MRYINLHLTLTFDIDISNVTIELKRIKAKEARMGHQMLVTPNR